MTARFCVGCRWHEVERLLGAHLCKAPIVDLVTGEPYAEFMHEAGPFRRPGALCGPDGRLWEAKDGA